MNRTGVRVLLAFLFINFAALNVYALSTAGLDGLAAFITQGDGWHAVALADLCIALGLVVTFLWKDAQRRGAAFWPFFGMTLATGSLGPLLYLLINGPAEEPATA